MTCTNVDLPGASVITENDACGALGTFKDVYIDIVYVYRDK